MGPSRDRVRSTSLGLLQCPSSQANADQTTPKDKGSQIGPLSGVHYLSTPSVALLEALGFHRHYSGYSHVSLSHNTGVQIQNSIPKYKPGLLIFYNQYSLTKLITAGLFLQYSSSNKILVIQRPVYMCKTKHQTNCYIIRCHF